MDRRRPKLGKRQWPLRAVVERWQSFETNDDYPDGWINEKLECGHLYKNDIAQSSPEHRTEARRRRCRECALALDKAS